MFNYFIPTRILFGAGQLCRLHKQEMPGKKALIVISAGKSIRANGYLQRVEEELKLAGVSSVVFDKILPNPLKKHVMEGAAMAKENGCDFVIGLGGGSSIDSAKAIAIMATNEGDLWDYIKAGSGKGLPIKNDPLPIVAITTTAGTGTEADPWAVISKGDSSEKIGIGTMKTFPQFSIVDPELMTSIPPHLTAFQGFDALFHASEGYLSKMASVVSELFSLKAIASIAGNLPTAVKNGKDVDAREQVALGNTLAGMVEAISTTMSEHSMEHAMSAFHHELPHGAGLIMISKAYYTLFATRHDCDEKLIAMAKAMGKKDAKSPMDFVDALVDLQKACGVDELKMSDYGIQKTEFFALAKNARDTMGKLFNNDPAPISEDECVAIFEASYK